MEITTKKTALSSLLALTLSFGLTGCSDRFKLDDDGNSPSWLGNSIYEELKNPNPENLTGSFNYFLRLADDLGYQETLNKTGSKTVFVANDEAFERFFKSNTWGVKSFDQLSLAQKKQLFYGSMLDNAMLVEMLSNVPYDDTSVLKGIALKHTSSLNTTDSITYVPAEGKGGVFPASNPYWDPYRETGIHMVMDATKPMLVHFTADQMRSNDITIDGDNSDFQVVTGIKYDEDKNSAFVFRNEIINEDVTCKNGYIHQLKDVLVLPGNLAEVIRTNGKTNLFSRMLDRFSAPFYDAVTTNNYNAYAADNGLPTIDRIYQKRYFSARSQGATLNSDPENPQVRVNDLLPFDPGWNEYTSGENGSNALGDLCTMFVPTDDALAKYFLKGGEGQFLIDRFGKKANTLENLEENIDSIPLNIVNAFVSNLMNVSFNGSVPSKFGTVTDDASDPMGLELSVLERDKSGIYDVKIANNGVAYMLNTVFAPNKYQAVSAPALLYQNMRVMNEAINDGSTGNNYLRLERNYYAYLLAMKANYVLFIPTDEAFGKMYIDPAYYGHTSPTNPSRALHFYMDKNARLACSYYRYDKATNTVSDSLGVLQIPTQNQPAFASQLIDILEYHTLVLDSTETFGSRRFYQTKHGAPIVYDAKKGVSADGVNFVKLAPEYTYNQKNGRTYALDQIIQPLMTSVHDVLNSSEQFSEFMALCQNMSAGRDIFAFADDKMSKVNEASKKPYMQAYYPFVGKNGLTDNINYFSNFNYTVYAPDNAAMEIAYDQKGLPRWEDIQAIYEKWYEYTDDGTNVNPWSTLLSPTNTTLTTAQKQELTTDRMRVLAMVNALNDFVRYHFQNNSVFADVTVGNGKYSSAKVNDYGVPDKLEVVGGSNQFKVRDHAGQEIVIKEGAGRVVNKLTRDYALNAPAGSATAIRSSSFAVIHQISTPLNSNASGRYDDLWTGRNATKKLASFRTLFDTTLYKRY